MAANEEYRKNEVEQVLARLENELRLAVNREEKASIRATIAFFKRELHSA